MNKITYLFTFLLAINIIFLSLCLADDESNSDLEVTIPQLTNTDLSLNTSKTFKEADKNLAEDKRSTAIPLKNTTPVDAKPVNIKLKEISQIHDTDSLSSMLKQNDIDPGSSVKVSGHVDFKTIEEILLNNFSIASVRTKPLDNNLTLITFETAKTPLTSSIEFENKTENKASPKKQPQILTKIHSKKVEEKKEESDTTKVLGTQTETETPIPVLEKTARASLNLNKATTKPNPSKVEPLSSTKKEKNIFTKFLGLFAKNKTSNNVKTNKTVVKKSSSIQEKAAPASSIKPKPSAKKQLTAIKFKNGLVLELNVKSEYSFAKAGTRKYKLMLRDFTAESHLLLPYFAPKDLSDISVVKANTLNGHLEVTIILDTDSKLSALPKGNSILIKAST